MSTTGKDNTWKTDDFRNRIWFVDNNREAERAVEKLWAVPRSAGQRVLSVHLEGVSVGSGHGRATLLTFGSLFKVWDGRDVVMFDVQTCPSIWDRVKGLLQSSQIKKVFHAGVNDLYAIQVQQGIRVENAFDIAVADYVIRWQEDPGVGVDYRSLNKLVEEYGKGQIPFNNVCSKTTMARKYRNRERVWTGMPLTSRLRAFAAADVDNTIELYKKMKSLVRRDEGRPLLDKIMWERLNRCYEPDLVRKSQKRRAQTRSRCRAADRSLSL